MCKQGIRGILQTLLALGLLTVSGFAHAGPDQKDNQYFAQHKRNRDCWEIHSLGTLGGAFSRGRDVNNLGQVVGEAETEPRIFDNADPPVPNVRNFISAPNGGPLTEILTSSKFWGESARAVNNAGLVVGTTTIGSSFPTSYVTQPGSNLTTNTIPFSTANDINNVGQTVWDVNDTHEWSAIGPNLGDQGLTIIRLPGWPDDPYFGCCLNAAALNDHGQVALNDGTFGYRWSANEGAINLTPDATGSHVADINNAGQIIGTLVRDGSSQAFITRRYGTSLVMLGTPGDGNLPTGLNSFGQIVGRINFNGEQHGYVTSPFNVQRTINLDTLNEVTRDGWSQLKPVAINDRGQIAGTGSINGQDRAFLLTPLWSDKSPQHRGQFMRCLRQSKP